jgi:hypothetical protein
VKPTPAKIAEVKEALQEFSYLRQYPTEKALDRISRVVATFADTEARWHHKLGGVVVPFQWMVDRCFTEASFFPIPKKMRDVYSVYFTPLDSDEYQSYQDVVSD